MGNYQRLFSSEYLGAWDAEGGALTLTIASVRAVTLKNRKGEEDEKPVIAFVEANSRPMILNKTNARAIAQMYGDETSNWIGRGITVVRAQVDMAGSTVWALRVQVIVAPIPAPPAARRGGARK